MANEINPKNTQLLLTKLETKWNTQIQQDTELVKPFVTVHTNCAGKAVEIQDYDVSSYEGNGENILGKRTMRKRKFYNVIPLEEDDKMDLEALDFTASNVMSEQRKAHSRMNEAVILGVMKDAGTGLYRVSTQEDGVCGGILAPNYTGEDGSVIETLDTAPTSFNVIPVDYSAKGTKTTAGMLIDKIALLRARYMMLDMFKADRGEEIVVAITPAQYMDMILWEQNQNKNYGFQSLVNGEVNAFLGVKFLITNMLPLDADGNRMCVAWLKSRVEFGVWKDAEFLIEPCIEYINARTQILIKSACGATRKDKNMVFLMPCKEVEYIV